MVQSAEKSLEQLRELNVTVAENSEFARRETCPVCLMNQGRVFGGGFEYSIAGNQTAYFQIKTGSLAPRVVSRIAQSTQNDIRIRFYEAPTLTDGSNVIVPLCTNRVLANTSTVSIHSNPTNVSGGLLLDTDILPGDRAPSAVGSSEELSNLILLKPNTDYVARIDNLDSGTAIVVAKIAWVE